MLELSAPHTLPLQHDIVGAAIGAAQIADFGKHPLPPTHFNRDVGFAVLAEKADARVCGGDEAAR